MAEQIVQVWQGMQDVASSQDPNQATGASLDNIGSLRGIPRKGATKSVVSIVRLFGTAGTLIPGTSTQFFVENSPTSIFSLNSDTTLVAGQSCIQTIIFSAVPASGQWQIALGGAETALLPYNANAAAVQAAIQGLQFAESCTVTAGIIRSSSQLLSLELELVDS